MVEQLINGIENLSKNIICSKGDVLLTGYVHPSNNNKAFQLSYDFNKLNHQKVNPLLVNYLFQVISQFL